MVAVPQPQIRWGKVLNGLRVAWPATDFFWRLSKRVAGPVNLEELSIQFHDVLSFIIKAVPLESTISAS